MLTIGLLIAGALVGLQPEGAALAADAPDMRVYERRVTAADDQADIEAVVVAFERAVREQNTAALQSLFYEGRIVWLATGHPKSRAFVLKMTSKAPAIIEDQGAYKMLGKEPYRSLRLEEAIGEPTIVTDGQLATVTFRYRFLVNSVVQNWGSESWQMAKTDAGWKIVHLLFSYRFPQVEGQPEGDAR